MAESGRIMGTQRPPNFLTPTTMVTIRVRENEQEDFQEFQIHKNFAVYYSPHFKAAFEGSFVEGETQTMEFTADPVVFNLLVDWIYTQKIQHRDGYPPRSATLIQLWILADYLLIPRLQNEAIDLYYSQTLQGDNCGPSVGAGWSARLVYESTAEGSPLRRLLVLHFSIFAERAGLEGERVKRMFPQQLFVDIAVCLAGLKEERSWPMSADAAWKFLDLNEFYVDE